MDLPDLGSAPVPSESLADALKKRLRGSLGPVDYQLGGNKIQAQTQYKDALIKGLLRSNGDMGLSVEKPLLGGNLQFNADRRDGNNNFMLQYGKQF